MQVVVGVLAGLGAIAALGWWWVKRQRAILEVAANELSEYSDYDVPAFRITLSPASTSVWDNNTEFQRLDGELTQLGYQYCGDFFIDEMDGIVLRGFCHWGQSCTAALYKNSAIDKVILDINRAHRDHQMYLVSNAPETGIEDPPNKITYRVSGPANAAEMHRQVLDASDGHRAIAVTPKLFPVMFEAAYAAEMDALMDRGGVTPEEIRQSAVAAGLAAPDEVEIERVRKQWQQVIDQFIDQEALAAFVRLCRRDNTLTPPPAETEHRLVVVHRQTDINRLADILAETLFTAPDEEAFEEDDAYEAAYQRYIEHSEQLRQQIITAFDSTDDPYPIAERVFAQLAAPANKIVLLGKVRTPCKARIFLLPEAIDTHTAMSHKH